MLVPCPLTNVSAVPEYGSVKSPVSTVHRSVSSTSFLRSLARTSLRASHPFLSGSAHLPKSASLSYPVFGARPLKRAIQQYIENPIAKLILEGKFGPKDIVPVDIDKKGAFLFDRVVH